MRAPRSVFFDLDGTLLDGSGLRESIARTCASIAARQPGLDAARLVEANGDIWLTYWPEIEERWTRGGIDSASASLEAWRRTLRSCGCDDESVVRLALRTHQENERAAHRLFDDVHGVLDRLRAARVPLALITNGASDMQREKLHVLGIESRFDAIIVSGEAGVAKPDPAIFARALDALGVERDRVCHVGDSLSADVGGAKASGIAAVWLNRNEAVRREGDPMPDLEIRSLAELVNWLPK